MSKQFINETHCDRLIKNLLTRVTFVQVCVSMECAFMASIFVLKKELCILYVKVKL